MQHIRRSASPENGAKEFTRISRKLMASTKGKASKDNLALQYKQITKKIFEGQSMIGKTISNGYNRKNLRSD